MEFDKNGWSCLGKVTKTVHKTLPGCMCCLGGVWEHKGGVWEHQGGVGM